MPFALFYKYLKPKVKQDNIFAIPISELPYNSAYLIKNKKIGILNNQNGIQVFSISCTHLGCVLNLENSRFICPCHGSIFSLNGKVIKGPALKPLKKIDYIIKNNNIIISL